ncbi:MAG: ParB family transcriptional regulator, chromosome partitioning protein [Patescibacteria group bacterium]|nr:ParB family transcriptional regulator, chromosome partitioning protein [Patescibacteria group bacterium]
MNFSVLKSAHMEPNTQNTSAPISDAETNHAENFTSAYSIQSAQSAQAPVASSVASTGSASSSVPLPKTGSLYFNNSIFWIEVEKIVPNPYQPRREFDPHALKDLSESIRMYGLLQPLVVTRREIIKEDGGLAVQYELISGERRLRASKLAGLIQVPVIIRAGEEDARVKLELAIIENLQREDLNAVDRARSFQRLADEFGLKHVQIAEKMGKSREYVTNSIRLLSLPEHMLMALSEKKISEGHTRPLLMLVDRPEEQETLFKEIVFKKITVREAESIARRVAVERTRKKDTNMPDPEIREFETKLNQALGTRVMIEKREQGGKVVIDFFNNQDLRHLLDMLERNPNAQNMNSIPEYVPQSMNINSGATSALSHISGPVEVEPSDIRSDFAEINSIASSLNAMGNHAEQSAGDSDIVKLIHTEMEPRELGLDSFEQGGLVSHIEPSMNTENLQGSLSASVANDGSDFSVTQTPVDDSTPSDAKDDEDLYSIKNFSI